MYDYTHIDKNIVNQQWFTDLKFPHGSLFMWSWLLMDSIGVYEVNLKKFCEAQDQFINPDDINIQDFVDDCNSDGKQRMFMLDEGRRLWFAPTVIFKNGNKAGFRKFNASDRDAAIVNNLAQREITRQWTLDQIKKNDKLSIDNKLIRKVAYYSLDNAKTKKFAQDLAKVNGYKIPKIKESPDQMKADYGHVCQYCGGLFDDFDLEIDHVIPRSQNGPDTYINKVPACQECNQKKGTKSVFLFMKEQGFEWTKGLQNVVDKLAKKRLLEYPTEYPFKRIKEKYFTYAEVVNIHTNPKDNRTQQDFEITDQEKHGKKLWRQKL